VTGGQADGAAAQGSARGRAEHGMDQAEHLAEDAVSQATRWLARTVERAREEVEDIWAEARQVSGRR
jgi:hypothetical protein